MWQPLANLHFLSAFTLCLKPLSPSYVDFYYTELDVLQIPLASLLFEAIAPAFAQLQNNQWRFGNGSGINFNNNPPTLVSSASLSTFEGSASVADRNTGNLLFYSDGGTVWGANNLPMPNRTGLLGGMLGMLSSTTAASIAPVPNNATGQVSNLVSWAITPTPIAGLDVFYGVELRFRFVQLGVSQQRSTFANCCELTCTTRQLFRER
jgi:hypothetical protein